MTIQEIFQQFVEGMKGTSLLEYVAVFTGVASVWYYKKENILVYPIGLVSTIIYIFLSAQQHLFGEASVNFYYTVMSIYGWILWARKDQQQHHVVIVTKSNAKEWIQHLSFFATFYVLLFFALTYIKNSFGPGAIPWADAFASASAYTGMWLMTKKKVESWIWWIVTNSASIPLYFVKGFVFTSVYFLILLIMAVAGLIEWKNRAVDYKKQPVSFG